MHGITARFDGLPESDFSGSWLFSEVERIVVAETTGEVIPALQSVEAAVATGLHAAGYVTYEAANGLDPALTTRKPGAGPLLWFALFRQRQPAPPRPPAAKPLRVLSDRIVPGRSGHAAAVAAIRAAIAAGETYQVNYTVRRHLQIDMTGAELYDALCQSQPAPFSALIETGKKTIVSASPELFFCRRGRSIVMRPMKGTAPRHRDRRCDEQAAATLRESAKERAENLMIVDLIRNDLGRIAKTGTVTVDQLFAVESYPTVHQMTSTVSAALREDVGLTEIFTALFPCGSVTGAPKKRTMEIIAKLEEEARGVYCGAIGFISPDETVFSVAIRTVEIDADGTAVLGLGGGITWDSQAEAEFAELCAKGTFFDRIVARPRLIEALFCVDGGYPRLERHLARLDASARVFDYPCDIDALRCALQTYGRTRVGRCKVRLTLDRDGRFDLSAETLAKGSGEPLTVTLADVIIDSADPLRRHKSERRELLDGARQRSGCDEVLFVNERGELTEGSYHTLVLRLNGRLLTPALDCGLLPGVLRGELLERGIIGEAILTPDDLPQAEAIWLINSVRGWRRGQLISTLD